MGRKGGIGVESVIISLKDYQKLKKLEKNSEDVNSYYLKIAVDQVELLEEIEEFLVGEKLAPGLQLKIGKALNNWYG